MSMTLRDQILEYRPFNDQERKDREFFLTCIDSFEDVLTRENELVHFSSSAFVISQNWDKVLMVYHNIYQGWTFPGGHSDGEENLLHVAKKEVFEETGRDVLVLNKNIVSLASYAVRGHFKHGLYVPAHTHLDVIYAMQTDDTLPLVYRPDESSGVKWVSLDDYSKENIVPDTVESLKKLELKLF